MRIVPTCREKPATAYLSFDQLNDLGLTPGSWVKVRDNTKSYYCRVWPTSMPCHQLAIDTFIQLPTLDRQESIIAVSSFKTALRVTVRARVENNVSKEVQMRTFGFVFDSSSPRQKQQYIQQWIDGMLVEKGAMLSRPGSILSVEVLDTHSDSPVLLARGTKITVVYGQDEALVDVDHLSKAMDALALTSAVKPKGLEKAYDALYEIMSYPFIHKEKIETLGIECPKGILLYGPPGVGKTFLVSSVARACGAKMFVLQGPEVYDPYIGESEAILRAKFKQAQDEAIARAIPVVLFIDEIDALTPNRDRAESHENRVVAQLLTLMDGIQSRGSLIVVGATNRPNAIDPALRRPGRFDREISIDAPNEDTRRALFASQLRHVPMDASVDLDLLAVTTNGFVAADVASLCQEAATYAVQRSSKDSTKAVCLTLADFQAALAVVHPSMQRGFQVQVEKMDWEDVGGLRDVKKLLKQAVQWPLLYKDSFARLGLKPPRGILLYGPPGCSKTTLVKVIASSSGAAFLSINGAQLYSPYVGDSEKVVRTTFQKARASAPAIIFLDETEAIVGKRNMGNGGSNSGDSVQERVLSTLLNEMDGVETAESVLVVGATNRPDMLDAALMRPGRFDRLIYVPPPDLEARLEILKIHTRHMPLSSDVDLFHIAERTDMYTGADIQNVCREAAMMALRAMQSAVDVEMIHFEKALNTIPPSLSPEKLSFYQPL